jgi:hypothetical protein
MFSRFGFRFEVSKIWMFAGASLAAIKNLRVSSILASFRGIGGYSIEEMLVLIGSCSTPRF